MWSSCTAKNHAWDTAQDVSSALHSQLPRVDWGVCTCSMVSLQKAGMLDNRSLHRMHQRALPSLKSFRCGVSGHGAHG